MASEEQRTKAKAQIKAAFHSFTEARMTLTIGEFQDHIAKNLTELGSQGFVASIGNAIAAAADPSVKKHPEQLGERNG
jgi:hypothetical protein